jgi:23S rRNA pseudouridine2605 synthase
MDNQGDRIQKVLSDNGILSRRKAEDAIRAGRVKINGHPALIGQKVNPRRDVISVDGEAIRLRAKKSRLYIMLHKPRGYVTTTSDELGRQCVTELVENAPDKVYPIGRLDKNSEGLLLFTNDGEFANTIMHPSNNISKTYRATVRPDATEKQLIDLSAGVVLDGRRTLPAAVHVLQREPGRAVLQITIHEGRNRQVRRMCEAVGLTVARLKRTSVGPVKLGMLKPGAWRELTPLELNGLRGAAKKGANKTEGKPSRP